MKQWVVSRTDKATRRGDEVKVAGDSADEVRAYYEKAGYHVHSVTPVRR